MNTLQITSANLDKPSEMVGMANSLKQFISENNLSSTIQGKQYVNVEGWMFAGGCLGIIPVLTECTDISADSEIKYRASVELVRLSDGLTVGRGVAICSNKEVKRRNADEYVISSMAQTRASGKAFRMLLAWIIKLAGYEACPAEEMDYAGTPETPKQEPKAASQQRPPVAKTEPTSTEVDPDKKPASIKEKQELILCLAHESVKKEDKEKMIQNINKLTSKRCQDAIWNLKQQARKYDNMHH